MDSYPPSWIQQLVERAGRHEVYSALNAVAVYYSIAIETLAPGHSSIGVQPFLSVLNTLGTEGLQATLDDILLFHNSLEEHLERLVFQAHREGRIRLKPSKILLFQEEVEYLGHTLS
ncbi:MAG: hypothetical protein GY696_05170 [Gammaproteobacteria bacterium]|nr:hypothetical protein [Gammaproteobacteria bacterium]